MNYTLEICANSVQSALNAQEAGAHRVELCDNLWESGTTPSYASLKKARELLDIGLFVLVRPRGGDFVYSDLEFEIIKEDIRNCKELGVDGIVSGVLNPDNTIDLDRTRELIDLGYPLPFTFHRAFDITPDLFQAMEDLISLGADRVLTSGGLKSAAEASKIITQLNRQANDRIIILPGGGINEDNIGKLLNTSCSEFHLTGNRIRKSSATENSLRLNGSTDIPESDFLESSVERILNVKKVLNEHFK